MIVVNDGYIRKIDELGRIVVPKDIRNKLKISDNENVMIECNDKKILISKFSYLSNYVNFIEDIGKLFFDTFGLCFSVYDMDKLIYSNVRDSVVGCNEIPIIVNSVQVGVLMIDKSCDINIGKLFSKLLAIFLLSFNFE